MVEHSIPVDVYNPGQVFACMGLLEAADVLIDDAEGGFDWSDPEQVVFRLRAGGAENPVAMVLEFLAASTPHRVVPTGFADDDAMTDDTTEKDGDQTIETEELNVHPAKREPSVTFPAAEGDRMSLPI